MKPRSSSKALSSHKRRLPAHELFPQPGVYRPNSFAKRKTRQKRPLLLGLLFLMSFLASLAGIGYLRRPATQAPFVLVEVRAIEDTGHPVTAARVIINNKPLGLTDSFGEWRRYLRLFPGEQLDIVLMKDGKPNYKGTRILRVPMTRIADHDFEVKSTIEMIALTRGKTVPPPPQVVKQAIVKEEFSDGRDLTDPSIPDPDLKPTKPPVRIFDKKSETEPDSISDANDSSMGIYFNDGLAAIGLQVLPFRAAPSNLLEKHQAQVLEGHIMPMLASDLQNLGIKVDRNAPWRLSLSYVPKLDQVGYIRGQITWQNPFGQAESTAFVAGFAKTFEETVRALSSLLRVHMKKSYWAFKDNGQWYIEEPSDAKAFWKIKPGMVLTDTNGQAFTLTVSAQHETWRRWRLQAGSVQPCANVRQRSRCMVSTQSLKDAPPMIGWKQRRLQIQGVMPKNVEVFVAGFLATPMGEGQWEYWGHPGSSHKALIMSQSRLLHSEVFADDSRAITVLRLPGSPIAKQSRR